MANGSGAAVSGAASGAAAGTMITPGMGTAIGAAVGLLGGLMTSAAQSKDEERRRKLEGELLGLKTQGDAAQAMTAGQQNAFNTMMQGYSSALRR